MPAYNVVCERKRLPLQRAIRVFFFWLQSFLALINWSGKICSMP